MKIGFAGATGSGKSSICNAIYGKKIFETAAAISCTVEVQKEEIKNEKTGKTETIIYDFPGYGDNRGHKEIEEKIEKEYKKYIEELDMCIIVIKSEDKGSHVHYKKVIDLCKNKGIPYCVVISQIDKLTILEDDGMSIKNNWINDMPTPELVNEIRKFAEKLREDLDIEIEKIIPVAALKKRYGIRYLINQIMLSSKYYGDLEIKSMGTNEEQVGIKLVDLINKLSKKYPNNPEIIKLVTLKNSTKTEATEKQIYEKICDLKSIYPTEELFKITGYSNGIVLTGGTVSDNYTIYQASKGHGFAAEKMNNMYDNFLGKDAKVIGGNNAKNGADRLVNGQQIQSKFCSTGKSCINECFKDGFFKYIDPNGNPMQIEVPKDKCAEAVKAMEQKIKEGKIPNISDPSYAKDIVKESPFTYQQAKNVAKFGTIESLTFDAIEGIMIGGSAMGISAALSFGHSIWNGQDYKDALNVACSIGVEVGGTAWLSNIAAKQLMRTNFATGTLKTGTDYFVKQIGSKNAAKIVNAVRGRSAIHGAAATKNLSKMLRGNVATGLATTFVLSSADVYRFFSGKISGKQVGKNVVKTGAGVVGGTVGWVGGATAGASIGSIIPGVGTVVGGFVGGIVGSFTGGSIAQKTADIILDEWLEIKDDIDEMLLYFNEEFSKLAFEHLLNEGEINCISNTIKKLDIKEKMMEMYSQKGKRREYANNLLSPIIEKEVKKRKKIILPTENEILDTLEARLFQILCKL